jgi:hypothetical protein
VIARSAAPVDVVDFDFFETVGTSPVSTAYLRPDLVPGQPVYLFGPAYPGGKAFNPNAFTDPPLDPSTGFPTRQGDLGRNVLRGFGATQWDFALHRSFNLSERVRLEFRAEFFNLLNHPNFGQPQNAFTKPVSPSFGVSTAMLGRSLSNDGQGLNPLYQIGGPRSIQLALRLNF